MLNAFFGLKNLHTKVERCERLAIEESWLKTLSRIRHRYVQYSRTSTPLGVQGRGHIGSLRMEGSITIDAFNGDSIASNLYSDRQSGARTHRHCEGRQRRADLIVGPVRQYRGSYDEKRTGSAS